MIKKLFITFLVLSAFTVQSSDARVPKTKKITVCKPVYTVEKGMYQGSQIVKCDKMFGVKNALSFPVVSPIYSKLENIDENLMKARVGKNQFGIVDYRGKMIVRPKYKDVAIAKLQMSESDSDYFFFGKINRKWYFINGEKEIPVDKLKRGEVFNPVFATSIHKIPHKVTVDKNKYRLWMGEIEMGDLLVNTPIKVHVSTKLPKWADEKIADLVLVSIFQKK